MDADVILPRIRPAVRQHTGRDVGGVPRQDKNEASGAGGCYQLRQGYCHKHTPFPADLARVAGNADFEGRTPEEVSELCRLAALMCNGDYEVSHFMIDKCMAELKAIRLG